MPDNAAHGSILFSCMLEATAIEAGSPGDGGQPVMKQLELFPTGKTEESPLMYLVREKDMWVLLNRQADQERMEEIARDVDTWKQIEEENEREHEAELEAWYRVMMEREIEVEALEQEIYEYMDQEFAE